MPPYRYRQRYFKHMGKHMVDRRLNDTGNQILAYMQREGARVTNKLLVDAFGFRQQCIQWQLERLVRDGKITKVSRGLYEIAGA